MFGQYLAASGGGGDAAARRRSRPSRRAAAPRSGLASFVASAAQRGDRGGGGVGGCPGGERDHRFGGCHTGAARSRPASSSFVSPRRSRRAQEARGAPVESACKAPAVELIDEDRRRMLATSRRSGEASTDAPESFEATVRACGRSAPRSPRARRGHLRKVQAPSGGQSAAPKVMTFEGFAQAMAHVAAEYSVKFEVNKDGVFKYAANGGAKALETAEKRAKGEKSEKEANAAPVRKPGEQEEQRQGRGGGQAAGRRRPGPRRRLRRRLPTRTPRLRPPTRSRPAGDPDATSREAYTDAELIAVRHSRRTSRGTMSVDEAS